MSVSRRLPREPEVSRERLRMSCVHFKFKSSLEYEKITFDGLHISLADLKDAIMKQKKIGLSNAFRLEVVDAQSKKGVCVLNDSLLVNLVPRSIILNSQAILLRLNVWSTIKILPCWPIRFELFVDLHLSKHVWQMSPY